MTKCIVTYNEHCLQDKHMTTINAVKTIVNMHSNTTFCTV